MAWAFTKVDLADAPPFAALERTAKQFTDPAGYRPDQGVVTNLSGYVRDEGRPSPPRGEPWPDLELRCPPMSFVRDGGGAFWRRLQPVQGQLAGGVQAIHANPDLGL